MNFIDEVLDLSQTFSLPSREPGILLVEFVLSIVWQLLDASLDDEGLIELTPEKRSRWPTRSMDMDIDGPNGFKETDQHEMLAEANTSLAIEMIVGFLQNTVTARILYLARRNMYFPNNVSCSFFFFSCA